MNIHYLQHVGFEDLAMIEQWLLQREHQISCSRLYMEEPLPDYESFDMLIVMGGPMGVKDEKDYPWLLEEKFFIEEAIKKEKKIVGICLGAQLLAEVMGARIFRNAHPEIGWFPVKLTPEADKSPLFKGLPEEFTPYHWHGDTFEIPEGAVRTSSSEGCKNQSFAYGSHILGLQFHMEMAEFSINNLIVNCYDEIRDGRYIQEAAEMSQRAAGYIEDNLKIMDRLLTNIINA
jgi:GMP synthase-like glutamine amidotransferase